MSDDLRGTVQQLVRKVDDVEGRLAKHDTRLTLMEATVTRLGDDLTQIGDDLRDNNKITLAAATAAQETKTEIQTAVRVLGAMITVAAFVVTMVQALS